jgi:hypothetical protein
VRSHRARVASATNTLRRALVQQCHNHFHATQCAPHVSEAPTSASLRLQGVLGRVQGDTTAYEFEDDEDDEGTLEQDSMATMEELKARHRELKLKEVRLLDERVRRMEAEEREAGAFRPQPRPLLGGGGSGGDGGGGGGGGRDGLLDNDGENLQLKTTKVHYLFGPTNRARVLTAFLQELILPELGENDMNFHYSRKMTVAMEALGLVEDNATIKKFENCYHKATVTVMIVCAQLPACRETRPCCVQTFTDAKKSFGSKFIDMVLDHSHLPLIKFGKKGDEPPNMPIHKVELPKLTEVCCSWKISPAVAHITPSSPAACGPRHVPLHDGLVLRLCRGEQQGRVCGGAVVARHLRLRDLPRLRHQPGRASAEAEPHRIPVPRCADAPQDLPSLVSWRLPELRCAARVPA